MKMLQKKISSQGNGVPETRIKQRVLDQCNKTLMGYIWAFLYQFNLCKTR